MKYSKIRRNLKGETSEQMVYRYIKCLAFMLKYSDRAQVIKTFKGFVDGLSYSDFITLEESKELYKMVESCSKSIIRHYRKEGRLL